MTTAEKYRQLERSPVINIARFIFNDLKNVAINTTLEKVIAEIKTGKTPSKQEKRYYEDDFFDWFKPDEIGSEKYLYTAKDKVSKYAYETKQATIFEPDTILINAIGDVGRISILKKQASSNQQITGIRLKEEVSVDYAYFYLLAHREYFYVDLFQTTLPIVNQKKINSIPFCYPTLDEQERIVKGLEEIENIKFINDLHIIENLDWKEEYKEICRNFFNLQFGTAQINNELVHQLDLIKQLRQAFLREAMQGKLVKCTNTKETGHQLLEKIKAEKAQLIAEKKLKKEKELPPITEDEIPFEIPEHWAWCRLGEISNIQRGSSPRPKGDSRYFAKSQTSYNWITISDISSFCEGNKLKQTREYLTEEGSKHSRFVDKNEFIIAVSGSTTGKCCLTGIDGFIYDGLAVVKQINSNLPSEFLMNYMTYLYAHINNSKSGASFPNINTDFLNNLIYPLPPLHEQEQIVAKLEELMAFCDGLEESIKESQGYNEKLLQQVLREALQPQ